MKFIILLGFRFEQEVIQWSPWENAVRLLALPSWIFATWRTRNLYLALLVHVTINAFSGISLFSLIMRMA